MNWWKLVIDKVLSGRYFLTVVCGAVFAYMCYSGKFEAVGAAAIITAVFKDYFDRKDRTPPAGGAAA